MTDKELLSTQELADYFKVHENTIYNWAKEGMPRMKLGHSTIRYDLEKVLEWLEERNEADAQK